MEGDVYQNIDSETNKVMEQLDSTMNDVSYLKEVVEHLEGA